MKANRPKKWKVFLVAFLFSSTLTVTQVRSANAYICFEPVICALVGLAVTIATVKTAICAPVAAFKSLDHEEGFTGAFKDCWHRNQSNEQPVSGENPEPAPTEAGDEAESTVPES